MGRVRPRAAVGGGGVQGVQGRPWPSSNKVPEPFGVASVATLPRASPVGHLTVTPLSLLVSKFSRKLQPLHLLSRLTP